jgi:Fe2+ or Zn2+ uptake regulation protein
MNLFYSENRPLRIKDIYQQLEKISPPVDMVTIYRTIEILQDKKLAHRVNFGEDATYYELSFGGHNPHYITCTNCAKHFRVNYCTFPVIEQRVLEKIPEFTSITSHAIEYFGLCKKCSAKKAKSLSTKKSVPHPKSQSVHRATESRR